MRSVLLPLAAVALLSAPAALAVERDGVEFPDRIEVNGKVLLLNGIGLRKKTIFKARVYLAALYVAERTMDEAAILASAAPKRLDVVFLRDVDAEDIASSWDEGLEKNCREKCESFAERLEKLKAASVDVKKGQMVTFLFTVEGLTVRTGEAEQKYPGRDFADLILKNFIGDPPTEDVKRGLLGSFDPPVLNPSLSR